MAASGNYGVKVTNIAQSVWDELNNYNEFMFIAWNDSSKHAPVGMARGYTDILLSTIEYLKTILPTNLMTCPFTSGMPASQTGGYMSVSTYDASGAYGVFITAGTKGNGLYLEIYGIQ